MSGTLPRIVGDVRMSFVRLRLLRAVENQLQMFKVSLVVNVLLPLLRTFYLSQRQRDVRFAVWMNLIFSWYVSVRWQNRSVSFVAGCEGPRERLTLKDASDLKLL
jgi:hypothetical protein